MATEEVRCALLADRHLGLAEGVRSLLETTFDAVVMVADEVSLFESARRLNVGVAVVEVSLSRGDALDMMRRIRNRFPELKLIALSSYAEKTAQEAVIAAGANGFVLKHCIATDLLPAVDAVLAGNRYPSFPTAAS